MSRRKPQKPIIPPPPKKAAEPPLEASSPEAAVTVPRAVLALIAQLAQDGLTALMKSGVPMVRLAGHAAALAQAQRKLGMGVAPPEPVKSDS